MTSTVPPDEASLHRYPGTSCLATMSLSLRDKTLISPASERQRFHCSMRSLFALSCVLQYGLGDGWKQSMLPDRLGEPIYGS